MKIAAIPISKVHPAAYNPRKDLKPSDPEYQRLAKAVDRFGMVEPLVWNERTGNLVGGHQRFKILKQGGAKTVEVSIVDLDDRDEKALNLALNKQGGEWDFASLGTMLEELKASDFDMEITGFDTEELSKYSPTFEAGLTDEDAVPESPKDPVTKPGDLWLLGKHRLLCGDSTDHLNVRLLLDGDEPRLMVTDPPYGVEYDPSWRTEAAKAGHISFARRREGDVLNDNRVDWSAAFALFPGAIAYVWHAGRYASRVQSSIEKCQFEVRAQIIWAKSRFVISRGHYHWQHEPCWYAVRKGSDANWMGDRSQTTLWRVDSNLDDHAKNNHGTQKPVDCMRRPILNHTDRGETVYDPFVGTGTTIIASQISGRVCYAMEIDPGYVDVAVQRFENFTGQKAVLTGHEEVAAR